MSRAVLIDGLLVAWGERFFNPGEFWGPPGKGSRAHRRPRIKKPAASGTGGSIARRTPRVAADAIRSRLADLTRRAPQVVVKVYGGGRGMKEVRAHLRYIARADHDGEVELEDQDGFRYRGGEGIGELADEWQHADVTLAERSDRREAVNIVLSMPAGTDPVALKRAARDFACREFSNHHYVMALHTIDTPHFDEDRHDPPSAHPHVHLVVRSLGHDGRRLNPRKADLHRWREGFAQALHENGVEAVATSRAHRLQRARGTSQGLRQWQRRTQAASTRRPVSEGRVARARQTQSRILARYTQVITILAESDDAVDLALARDLAARFGLAAPASDRHGRMGRGAQRINDAVEPKDPHESQR